MCYEAHSGNMKQRNSFTSSLIVNHLAEIKIRVMPQYAGYVFKYISSDLVKFRIGLENFKGVFTRVWLI